jgi:benzodiazapine receptor
MKRFFLLMSCVALPLIVGGISGFFTVDGVKGWYQTLVKPGFTPPNYLFGPVWTFLYALMGVAFFRIVEKPSGVGRTLAIRLFLVQLFFNFCWSLLFFSMHLITAALVDIVVLWGFIVWMIFQFRKLDAFAGYSQIPYLLWVSFATALTTVIWWLNG